VGESVNTICMYAPSADGGMAQYAWELMTALARHPRAGCRYELVTSVDLDPQFRSALYGINAVLPPLRHRSTFRTRLGWVASRLTHYPRRERAFLKWLRGRPDVTGVHLQEWTPWLAAGVIRRIHAMGKRVYHTVHNVVPHQYPVGVPRWLVLGWTRRARLMCDGLFVHTRELAEELSASLGRSHPPITVVPHGVWTVRDVSGIPPMAERLALKRLLFFGSMRRNKGLHVLLDAMERMPDYRLTIAGEPQERLYFEDEVLPRVRRLQAAGSRVDLIDRFVSDGEVGPLFASHSAVMLPYTSGFVAQSGVVFMAIAHDVPVVASHAGGLREVLEQFRVGTGFENSSPEAVSAAVRELHEHPTEDLTAGLAQARRRFSWEGAARATIDGYSATQGERREARDVGVQTHPAL
jgi:glycosyltransferase involved in cell wall biosynthesis